VIDSKLPPILHRLRVIVKFSLARGECLTFMLFAEVIPCQYRCKWYIAKNLTLWPTFPLQKVSVYLQPLLHNPPRKLPNSVKLCYGCPVSKYYITAKPGRRCRVVEAGREEKLLQFETRATQTQLKAN